MPPQKMRLEAEMKDNASPAVRKLREELSNLQAASADTRGVTRLNAELTKLKSEAAADASPAVRKLRAELAELQKSTAENRAIQSLTKEIGALKKMSGEVQATAGMKAFGSWFGEAKTAATGVSGVVGGLPSILGAIGVGGIAAGASVAGLAAEMKRLGDSALDMKELSREAGISLEFVNRWSHAGEHFAVGTDAMKGALDGFASQLPDFDRGIGGLFKEFSLWPDLVRKMRSESPAEALMDALRQAEEVGRTKGPQVQKQILDSIFPGHGADMEKLFRDGGLKGLLDQLQKPWAGPSPEYLQAAQKLRDSTLDFNNALQKFENTTGPKFLDMMTRIVDEAARFFDPDRSRIAKKQRAGGAAGEQHELTPEQRKKVDDALGTPVPPGSKPGRADDDPLDPRHPLRGLSRGAYLKRSSYDGAGFGNLLQNASYTSGGTGSGTMEGAIAEGSKSGVLAALREMAIENGLKGDGGAGDGGGTGGGGSGSGSGGGGGSGEGTGSGGGAEPHGRRALGTREARRTASGGYGGGDAPQLSGDAIERATSLIKAKEGFKSTAYWDVNHWRLGYGSDTMTDAQGHVHEVQKGDSTDRQDADRDLARRVKEFAARAATQVGTEHWKKLSQNAQAALTSMAYNYGGFSKLRNVRDAIASEDPHRIAEAIRARANDNGGVNSKRRMQEADLVERGDQAQVSGTASNAPMSDDVRQRLQEAKKHAFLGINQECVSLARAFSNTAETVFDWRRGDAAQDGKLKPGTPIATFLDRAGKLSDRYAGGGTGTRGANRDHAAVFENYATQNWHRGMMVLEQSKGRPIHERFYPFGDGVGEKNGSNYFAIQSARTGKYLGENNPMNRRADSPAVAANPPPSQRKADADLSRGSHEERESQHSLTVDIRDPGGHVKSTHLKSQGPMRVEMRNRWKTGQSPLVQA